MADPSIQTFCCHRVSDTSVSEDFLSEFNSESYNTVCLASSVIGMFGAIYQILPRERLQMPHRWVAQTASRGRHIVVWLAVADLLASFGVFVRSVLWLNYSNWSYRVNDSTITILCGISAVSGFFFRMGVGEIRVVSGVDSVFLHGDLVVDYGVCCGHEAGSPGAWGSPAKVSHCSLDHSCYFDCIWVVYFVPA